MIILKKKKNFTIMYPLIFKRFSRSSNIVTLRDIRPEHAPLAGEAWQAPRLADEVRVDFEEKWNLTKQKRNLNEDKEDEESTTEEVQEGILRVRNSLNLARNGNELAGEFIEEADGFIAESRSERSRHASLFNNLTTAGGRAESALRMANFSLAINSATQAAGLSTGIWVGGTIFLAGGFLGMYVMARYGPKTVKILEKISEEN